MPKKKSFKQFKKELLQAMMTRYGLTQNDSRYDSDEAIRSDFEAGLSIDDCCRWIESKDDLNRIDLEPFALNQGRRGTQRSPFGIGS